jgi:GTP cyclohydrolase II
VYRWEDPAALPELSNNHLALVLGQVRGQVGVPVRVQSECLTGEVFGSLKCDCGEQLARAEAEIAKRGVGIILYLRQEGRGIGLANKVRAYALQARGVDTVDANLALHLPIDARQYDVAAAMLQHLGVKSIQLMTNNPHKLESLQRLGVAVVSRIPVLVAANEHSAPYLEAKRRRLHHQLPEPVAPDERKRTAGS